MRYENAAATFERDELRLEAVTTCVGFDDLLDYTLTMNHPHLDTMIVVTSHEDKRTQGVCHKHGVICVQTDLFKKNGRSFNKGAAINDGISRYQYFGWRLHLDADIVLPDNFRRLLFNHSSLDADCLYGADRVNVVGKEAINKFIQGRQMQHSHTFLLNSNGVTQARFVDPLHGYCPLGFFQLWNARNQHSYPYSLGTAEHDDVMFAAQWPQTQRRHLPTVICYQLCSGIPQWGEHWEGKPRRTRLH